MRGALAPDEPVDLTAFVSMLRDAGIESSADQLLTVFVDTAGERLEALGSALRRGDIGEAERAAHLMKSGAGTISATRLAELLRQAEAAAKAGDRERMTQLEPEIVAEYQRVHAFIDSHVRPAVRGAS